MNKKPGGRQIQMIAEWLGSGSINIFGSPFAGKDTQGRRLAELLKAPLIGGGDILRNNPGVPEHVRQIIAKGKLAPSDDYLRIITPYLSNQKFSGQPLILSAVGRWHGEEQLVLRAAKAAGHPIKAVILLYLNEDEVRRRWTIAQSKQDRGGRSDDDIGVLDVRLKEFSKKTSPVIDFYRRRGLLIELDGSATPNKVTEEILNQLAARSKN